MSWRTSPVRVLVTGFGPFPGVVNNASALLVSELERRAPAPGVELFTIIIPVIWADARTVNHDAMERIRPHAIVHFGVSKRSTGFGIETRAFNMSGPKQDLAGIKRTGKRLDPLGKPVLHGTLPPPALLRALRDRGFPAQLSNDAGRYLCNALFYWSLAHANTNGSLVSFVHMPAFGADATVQPRLSQADAVAGADVLVRAGARAVLRARLGGNRNRESKGDGSQAFHGTGRGSRRAGCR